MLPEPDTIIRMPADVARVVLSHPEFRYQGYATRLRGDWVERRSDKKLFFEVHDAHPKDAADFMAFARRVAGHLIPSEPEQEAPNPR